MNDEALTTCPASEPHNHNIKDRLTHFLGCIDSSERWQFLNDDDYHLWRDEVIRCRDKDGLTDAEGQAQAREKREKWKSDCVRELRRIDFLRQKLSEEKDDGNLVANVLESRKAWQSSKEYQENIESVRKWRRDRGKLDKDDRQLYEPSKTIDSTEYVCEKDINVPFMYFSDPSPADEQMNAEVQNGVQFAVQETSLHHLLDEQLGERNLLFREREPKAIKYFHIPSNNMIWAEEAISRYFNQSRPDLHAIRNEAQRQTSSESALILGEANWRGQLQDGHNSTGYRLMQSMCKAVSSNPDGVDTVPQNLVLFMPYLDLETFHGQRRFAQLAEEIVRKRKLQSRNVETLEKRQEQQEEQYLPLSSIPAPDPTPKTSSVLGEVEDRIAEAQRRMYIKAIATFPEEQVARIRRAPLEVSGDGRAIIPGTERNKLGQYLIDAAKLYEGMNGYRDRKILEKYLTSDPPLHPRQTLDQAFYQSSSTIRSRQKDQFVYRHTAPSPGFFHTHDLHTGKWRRHEELKSGQVCDDCTANTKRGSRVVIVDQLWMWILDSKTIVTCFPDRYGTNEHGSPDIQKSLQRRFAEVQPNQRKSVHDLALIVLEECCNWFFGKLGTSDIQPRSIDVFSDAIGNILHEQTISFERLWRWTADARLYSRSWSNRIVPGHRMPQLELGPEISLKKEINATIKDLSILIHINKQQRDVIKHFITDVAHMLDPHGQFEARAQSSGGLSDAHRQEPTRSTMLNIEVPDSSGIANRVSTTQVHAETQHEYAKAERHEAYQRFIANADKLLGRVDDGIEELEKLERSAEIASQSVQDLMGLKNQQEAIIQVYQSLGEAKRVKTFTNVTIIFIPLYISIVIKMCCSYGVGLEHAMNHPLRAVLCLLLLFFGLYPLRWWSRVLPALHAHPHHGLYSSGRLLEEFYVKLREMMNERMSIVMAIALPRPARIQKATKSPGLRRLLTEYPSEGSYPPGSETTIPPLLSARQTTSLNDLYPAQFIDSRHVSSTQQSMNIDKTTSLAFTKTSSKFESLTDDRTTPAEPLIESSHAADVISLFTILVNRSVSIVKALDHAVKSEHLKREHIELQIRADLESFVSLLKLEIPPQYQSLPSILFDCSRRISSLIIRAAIVRCEKADRPLNGDEYDIDNNETLDQDDLENYQITGQQSDQRLDKATFERLLLESKAFPAFLVALYDIGFPDFVSGLNRILDSEKLGAQTWDVRELFSELAYAQPTQITKTNHSPGFSDKLKGLIESTTGAWNWWPLSDPLKPLDAQHVRISWTCRCGRVRNENVPKKVAKCLVSLVASTPPANSIPARPSSSISLGSHLSSAPSSGGTFSGTSSSAVLSRSQMPLQSSSLLKPTLINSSSRQTRTIFFMTEKGAMHPGSMGLGQSRISTQGKCNDRFFADIRNGYWKYRGWIRKNFSIYQFGYCEFYRFSEYAVSKYAKSPQEEVPDLDQYKGEYYYRKTKWMPQVSHEEFRDRFWNCLSGCGCNDNGTVDLIPQKIDQTAPAEEKVFYGIVAREEKQIYMAAIYLTMMGLSIFPSVWFFFAWLNTSDLTDEDLLANRKGNLSNAIVPLSLCLTLLGCVLGTLIAI